MRVYCIVVMTTSNDILQQIGNRYHFTALKSSFSQTEPQETVKMIKYNVFACFVIY